VTGVFKGIMRVCKDHPKGKRQTGRKRESERECEGGKRTAARHTRQTYTDRENFYLVGLLVSTLCAGRPVAKEKGKR